MRGQVRVEGAGWRALLPDGGEALYALASLGGTIAYIPLLVLLLPRRVEAVAGTGAAGLHLLGGLLILGGAVASLANIAAGRLSDVAVHLYGTRRPVMIVGLVGLVGSYALLAQAHAPLTLALGLAVMQGMLNCVLAPLGALMADHVPDHRKGRTAGLFNATQPLATASVGLVAALAPVDDARGFAVAVGLAVLGIAPLVALWPFPAMPRLATRAPVEPQGEPVVPLPVRRLALLWLARWLIQIGGGLMIYFLYPMLAGLARNHMLPAGHTPSQWIGVLALFGGTGAVLGAWGLGHVSDALRRRRLPLIAMALVAAGGLALAGIGTWPAFVAGYILFHVSLSGYLSVDQALVTTLVEHSPARGRVLGLMNLSNTLPAMICAALSLLTTDHTAPVPAIREAILAAALAGVVAAVLVHRARPDVE